MVHITKHCPTCKLSDHCETGAISITGGVFSDESVPVVIGSVECAGNESHILECSHLTSSNELVINCDSSEVAGVVCQG